MIDLINRLESHNIKIVDKIKATEILFSIPYNHLTSTLTSLTQRPNSLTIEELYLIHLAKLSLHNILLKHILQIEQNLKNKMSCLISKQYGVTTEDYLLVRNYGSGCNSTIRKIKEIIENPSNNSSLKHYKTTHQNIPPWILLENMFLGDTLRWKENLKTTDKIHISRQLFFKSPNNLNDNEAVVLSNTAFKILRNYRNDFAHLNKSHNHNNNHQLPRLIMEKEYSDSLFNSSEYNKDIGKNDLTALLSIICIFNSSGYNLQTLYIELYFLKQTNSKDYVNSTGLLKSDLDSSILTLLNLPENIMDRVSDFMDYAKRPLNK